jgi:hypothetical protein
MGRGNRQQGSVSGARAAHWQWQEEALPSGPIYKGVGRDGDVILLDEGDWLLRLDDGRDYDTSEVGTPGPRSLWTASEDNVFAAEGGKLWRFAPDESESEVWGDFEPLALFPSADGICFVYRGAEGTMYTEFDEDMLVPHSEYLLSSHPTELATTLAAPGGGGVALFGEGKLRYFGPQEYVWDAPTDPGWIEMTGDPHNPFIALVHSSRRGVFFPERGEIPFFAAARDWHLWQQGQDQLFAAITGDEIVRIKNGVQEGNIGPFADALSCRILPGGDLLVATPESLEVCSWDGERREILSPAGDDDILLAVHDESAAEVVVGRTLWRGEI